MAAGVAAHPFDRQDDPRLAERELGGQGRLAYQGITYTTREKVLEVGPIKATKEKEQTIPLPPILGGLALALLIGTKGTGLLAVPILLLTARTTEQDRIAGFEADRHRGDVVARDVAELAAAFVVQREADRRPVVLVHRRAGIAQVDVVVVVASCASFR